MDLKITKGRYKSISAPFEWLNLPSFSILTGLNGSGKTQLLELIRLAILNIHDIQLRAIDVTLSGVDYKPWEVAYTQSLWHIGDPQPSTHDDISNRVLQDANILEAMFKGHIASSDLKIHERAQRLMKRILPYADPSRIGQMDLRERMRLAEAEYVLDSDAWEVHTLPQQLQRIIWEYYLSKANQQVNPSSTLAIPLSNANPPWVTINELLKDFRLPYRVTHPESLMTKYRLGLRDLQTDLPVDFANLSSGEKVLMSLGFWLYTFSNHGVLPRLVLLDEPDAHLHPSMIKSFIDVLRDTLIAKHGCRVIMTTHRADTIVFAPEGALFEMRRGGGGPSLCSKMTSIGKISNNLLMAMPSARLIMVESEADERFYKSLVTVLSEDGKLLNSALAVFLRMSSAKGAKPEGGGKSHVKSRVKRLRDEGILNVCGIIDRDQGEQETDTVFVLRRYNIENYIYDPIQVFAALVSVGKAPSIKLSVALGPGSEHKLPELPVHDLQSIVKFMCESIESRLTGLTDDDRALIDVNFIGGMILQYPRWHLEQNGKMLMSHYRKRYESVALSEEIMFSLFHRVRLLPADLLDLFLKILLPDKN